VSGRQKATRGVENRLELYRKGGDLSNMVTDKTTWITLSLVLKKQRQREKNGEKLLGRVKSERDLETPFRSFQPQKLVN